MNELILIEALVAQSRVIAEIREPYERIEKLTENAEGVTKEFLAARERNIHLRHKLDELKKQHDAAEALVDLAEEEKRQALANLESLKAINSDLLRQLEAAEERIDQVTNEAEKELEWLKLELETARAKADDTGPDELTAAIQENATLKIENSEMTDLLDAERLTVEDLRSKLAAAERQAAQQQQIIAGLEAKATQAIIADFEAEISKPQQPTAEEAGPEAPEEGEPQTLNMEEFSKALRIFIQKNGGTRNKALKKMGFNIPSAVNQALMTKTSGTMKSKHAATFVKFLGPQILQKRPV